MSVPLVSPIFAKLPFGRELEFISIFGVNFRLGSATEATGMDIKNMLIIFISFRIYRFQNQVNNESRSFICVT